MIYDINVEGLSEPIKMEIIGLAGKIRLTYKGEKLERVKSFTYKIERENNEISLLQLERTMFGFDLPNVYVDNYKIDYVREISIIEKTFMLFPIGLLFFGVMGVLMAVILEYTFIKVYRRAENIISGLIGNLILLAAGTFIAYFLSNVYNALIEVIL